VNTSLPLVHTARRSTREGEGWGPLPREGVEPLPLEGGEVVTR